MSTNTVLDKQRLEEVEKQQHNSQISEQYRKLLGIVDGQFSTAVPHTENSYEGVVEKEPFVSSTPVAEQQPEVKEYTPSPIVEGLFTVEHLPRMEEEAQAKATQEVYTAPVQTTAVVKAAPVSVAQYSLTPFAKMAMAIFTLVVIAMLAIIGINSQIIQQKSIRIKNLEEKKQELTERNEEVQRYIQELQTEESIVERATQQGLI